MDCIAFEPLRGAWVVETWPAHFFVGEVEPHGFKRLLTYLNGEGSIVCEPIQAMNPKCKVESDPNAGMMGHFRE
jgi:hypothetical protein